MLGSPDEGILSEGLVFVFFVKIDSIINELDKICIKVNAFILFVFGLIVNIFDDIVMLLII